MKTRIPKSECQYPKTESRPNNVPRVYRHVVKMLACQFKVKGRDSAESRWEKRIEWNSWC